jgi:branched-chain amino acid transport system permease protein
MLGSIYAMIGVALTLSIGVLKFLNFSIPGLFMIGGMSTWVFIRHGMPWQLAALYALAIGAAASLVVERFTWRWMRNAQEFVPLVSSMAFLILFENLAVAYWGSELHSVPPQFGDADWRIGGLVVSLPQLFGLASSIVLIWALSSLLSRTRFGRGLRTIAEDSDTALLLGVDINRIVPLVFVISGLFAALAGVLFALNYRQVHPFMGEALGLKGISAMVVGGMGNIWGAIAGGLIIGMTEALSIRYFGADFVDIFVFGLLLFILIARPTGLFGGVSAGARA